MFPGPNGFVWGGVGRALMQFMHFSGIFAGDESKCRVGGEHTQRTIALSLCTQSEVKGG